MAGHVPGSLLQRWAETQRSDTLHQKLYSRSTVQSMTIGTGATIISSAIDLIQEQLPSELIFVTCFWARSDSLDSMVKLLSALSKHAVIARKIIRIRICVSSLSILQKAFHTWYLKGRIYNALEWRSKLHLPFDPDALPGLDLRIKSVFIPPLSVMHSKFIIIDQKLCILPSCNVSWEQWFECSVQLRGPIVDKLYNYWESFWGRRDPAFSLTHASSVRAASGEDHPHTDGAAPSKLSASMDTLGNAHESHTNKSTSASPSSASTFPASTIFPSKPIPTLLLPSSHHQNPRFRPFSWQKLAPAPSTPLNDFQLHLFATATRSIFIRTPNLTCHAAIAALLSATRRGINVHILTNRKLMTLEQIVTAVTTTPRCVKAMLKHYALFAQSRQHRHNDPDSTSLETGLPRLGKLKIEYYDDLARGTVLPVKAHIKLMIVDERVVVLGSGNQDRASWYTSQEVGVALENEEVARRFMQLAARTPAEMLM